MASDSEELDGTLKNIENNLKAKRAIGHLWKKTNALQEKLNIQEAAVRELFAIE